MELKCNYFGHWSYPIQSICCKIDCQKARPSCAQCIIDNHHDHVREIKSIHQFQEWSQKQLIVLKKLQQLQNDLLEFVSLIDDLIKSISIDSIYRVENCSLIELDQFTNKLIYLDQIERKGLTNQTLPILTQAINNFKQEINKLKGQMNSFHMNKQFQGKMQTKILQQQILDPPKLRIKFISRCPDDCNCRSSVCREWNCKCGLPYQIDEDGDVICLKCTTKCFIKNFKFQCEKAKQLNLSYQFTSGTNFLMAFSQSVQSADYILDENKLIQFTSSLNMSIYQKWNR